MRKAQAGMSMLELMAAIAITATLVVVSISYSRDEASSARAAQAAAHLRAYVDAARTYIDANENTLLATVGTTAAVVQPSTLAGYAPPGFSVTSPFGGGYTLHIRQTTSGRLDGLLVSQTTTPPTGAQVRQVAGRVGGGAGFVTTTGSGTAPTENWTIPAAEFTSGWRATAPAFAPLYALYFDDTAASGSASDAAVLYRNRDDSRPERNRMSTALDMGGNDVNAAGVTQSDTVNARDVVATEGIRANHVSVGRADWKAVPYPYETIQVPDTLTMRLAAGDSEMMAMNVNGVHVRNNAHFNSSAHVAGTLTSASRLRSQSLLRSEGEVHVGGWIRSWGGHGWYSESFGGGWHMTDPNWVRSYNDRGIYTGGTIQSGHMVSNTAEVYGNLTVHGGSYTGGSSTTAGNRTVHGNSHIGSRLSSHDLLARRIEQCNVPCAENGVLSRTSAGQPIACVSGQWRCLSLASSGTGGGTNPPGGGACFCPPGFSPFNTGCMRDSQPHDVIYCP